MAHVSLDIPTCPKNLAGRPAPAEGDRLYLELSPSANGSAQLRD